ncbi:hypothetical protein N8077_02965 [Myxococcota bacterium]|nr:hypothetical protein [Myxococcota bacterium]
MSPKTKQTLEHIYDEHLKILSIQQLKDFHWDDSSLMETLKSLDDKYDSSVDAGSIQHKLHHLKMVLELDKKGQDHAITVI